MKKNAVAAILLCTVMLSGCGDKVQEDSRMANQDEVQLRQEYNIYKTDLVESGYNWFGKYVNDFIKSLEKDNYKVDGKYVQDAIKELDIKYSQVKDMNADKIRESINFIVKKATEKEEKNRKYDNKIAMDKKYIEKNKEEMMKMLDIMRDSLKLGLDGEYSKEDLQKINSAQKKIIEIYNSDIKK